MTSAQQSRRTQLITLIHIARSQLGMSDDAYRANLAHYGNGKTSSAKMSVIELEAVLSAFKKLGFKVQRKPGKKRYSPARGQGPTDERAAIRAIWIFMHRAGFIQDGSESALDKWVFGISKVQSVQWLTGKDAPKVLNSLKRWAKRCMIETLADRGCAIGADTSYAKTLKIWQQREADNE